MGALDVEVVHETGDRRGKRLRRGLLTVRQRWGLPEARHVERDRVALGGQQLHDGLPDHQRCTQGVDENDRLTRARAYVM